jgi:uncharacterized protein
MKQRITAEDFRKEERLSRHSTRSKEVARALDAKAEKLPCSVDGDCLTVSAPTRTLGASTNAIVTPLRIPLPSGASISAILRQPEITRACLVFAHGAGAGMNHEFMTSLSSALESEGIATMRFQFPFMEQGTKRPDSPAVAEAAIRAVVAETKRRMPDVPLFAGGKSFGGRMTSQAQARAPLPEVGGLVFVGFPLHPAGKPGVERAAHLREIAIPMMFLQGTRDALADTQLIKEVVAPLGSLATLHAVDGADHAFHVLVKSGRTNSDVIEELAAQISHWMRSR